MIANYHCHTSRCNHAGDYPDEAFVQSAIDNGFRILGFSDHTPWPYETDFRDSRVRMDLEELPGYLESVAELKEKYRGRIKIYTGLECEYFPNYLPWLQTQLPNLDYLVLGNHWRLGNERGELYFGRASKAQDVADYTTFTTQGMETGLFSCLVHPDLVFYRYPAFGSLERDCMISLCEKAKELDIPLEYNLLGEEKRRLDQFSGLGYPLPEFWQIAAKVGCKAILGLDAHHPYHFGQKQAIDRAQAYLNSLGMTVLETLPGLGV